MKSAGMLQDQHSAACEQASQLWDPHCACIEIWAYVANACIGCEHGCFLELISAYRRLVQQHVGRQLHREGGCLRTSQQC